MALLLEGAGRAFERPCRAPLSGRLRHYPTVWDRPGDIGHRLPSSRSFITGRQCRSARGTRIKAASQIPRIYAVHGNRYASCRLRESTHPHVPISPMESPEAPCTGCHRPRPFQIGGASHIRSSGAEPSDGGLRSAALSNASSIRRAGHPCSRSIRTPGRADRRTGAAGKRGMKTAGPCSGRGK